MYLPTPQESMKNTAGESLFLQVSGILRQRAKSRSSLMAKREDYNLRAGKHPGEVPARSVAHVDRNAVAGFCPARHKPLAVAGYNP